MSSPKHHRPDLLSGSVSARNPIVETLMPSPLYVRMAGLLEFGIQQAHIAAVGMPPSINGDLSLRGRIRLLERGGNLRDAHAVHRILDRRNDLVHISDASVAWEQLDHDLGCVESELQGLGLIGERPDYEFYAERGGLEFSQHQDGAFAVRLPILRLPKAQRQQSWPVLAVQRVVAPGALTAQNCQLVFS